MTANKNTFNKQERLCSKKRMDLLFKKGESLITYPIKVTHMDSSPDFKYPAQVMFVVAKRNFKKAHDRNHIKRRMREVYRLNKTNFYEFLGERKKILAFMYISKKEESYDVIAKAITKLLQNIK